MKILKNTLKTIALLAIVFSCSNNLDLTQEDELNELNNLKKEIELIVSSSVCTGNTTCDFIAFGNKPCGGPRSYLVFSNSIDTELLKQKVISYNNLEHAFNIKWNIASDCMFLLPPTEVGCLDGKCEAIY